MSEWWTYRPSSFLMFAPRSYWRLFELHNAAWWPAPLLLVLAGAAWVAWMVWMPRRRSVALRVGVVGLAAAWAFVAVAFLLPRYAPINWAANSFAVMFGVQAIALAALATRGDVQAAATGARRTAGTLLCGWALLGHPLLTLAFGRPWLQGEFFALAPDATVIATLGVLVWLRATGSLTRGLLGLVWLLALAWCAVTTATLLTMGEAQGWVVLVAAVMAIRMATVPAADEA